MAGEVEDLGHAPWDRPRRPRQRDEWRREPWASMRIVGSMDADGNQAGREATQRAEHWRKLKDRVLRGVDMGVDMGAPDGDRTVFFVWHK